MFYQGYKFRVFAWPPIPRTVRISHYKGKLYLKTNLSLTKHGYYGVLSERLLLRDSEVKQNEEAKFCKSF